MTVAPEVNTRGGSSDAATFVGGVSSAPAQAHVQIFAGGQPVLMPGAVLAKRYEIVQVLGEGGMGAVYKARDREVDRMVALKVIRPDLAGNPAILDRFKQELVLSHQVTHRNVVRIYDLGDADGMKFITMEYIEGKDLRSVIEEHQKLPAEQCVDIMRQVCQALAAAHGVGVIHRDLKPQNIMLDAQGRVVVMDFGLARSLDSNGMTQSGALVGTFEYMSPEQGMGKHLDERSDLFTVGLIFYELLTGKMPYKADSALASLMKRTQERAVPISDLDGSLPRALSDIVAKCLEADLKKRYQTVEEILTDLEGWQGRHAAASLRFGDVDVWAQTIPWRWIGIGLAVVLVAAIAWLVHGRLTTPKASSNGPVVSIAVVPFRNASGDPSLDWLGASIADMLTTDMGQAASVRTVSADRLHQILRDLRITPDTGVDNDTLRRLGEFSSADQVISGQYAKFGDHVRIDATLNDFKHQRSVPLKAEAPSEKELLAAVDQLAKAIQQSVAVSPTVAKELVATAFTPSSKSVDALRDYSEGTELAREGKHLDALKKFQASVKEDPQFAFAYAKLGQTYAKLGYDKDADAAARKAVDLADTLPDAERYRIVAIQARISNDDQKAIDAYESLLKTSPNDVDLQFHLAEIYFASGAYPQARELYTKLLGEDPKYVDALLGISRVLILSGDSNSSMDYLNRAMSLAVQVSNDEEKAAALHLLGVAYSQLNKPQDAIQSFQNALDIERRVGDKRATAKTLDQMAPEQDLLGDSAAAFKSYQDALKLWKEIGDKRGAGSTGINLGLYYDTHGDYEKALAVTRDALQLEHEIGEPADEAQCLNNIGWFNLEMARYDDAMTYFQQGLQLRQKLDSPANVADSYYNLADTSTRVGQFDNALADYLKAVDLWRKAGDKRGVAIASFGMGKLFEYQGRYGAAVSSMEDATKALRDAQDRSLWLAEVLGGYGNALALIGRSDDAQKNLTEALSLARELKNDPLSARILGYQGDRLYYSGDYKGARPLYEQAQQLAGKTKDPYGTLIAKINAAKLGVKDGRSREAIGTLTALRKQADSFRMKYLAAECSLALGEALANGKDYVHAQQELEDALHRAQDLGARTLVADAHYQLAMTLRAKDNNGDAAQHLASARKIVDDIQQEAHTDQLLKRADLNPIYTASR